MIQSRLFFCCVFSYGKTHLEYESCDSRWCVKREEEVCCSVLQCVAVCCSVLQRAAKRIFNMRVVIQVVFSRLQTQQFSFAGLLYRSLCIDRSVCTGLFV